MCSSDLEKHLERTPWVEDYDLIVGLVGLGVYALERLPRPAARKCLESVIDRLDEMADRRPDGITWFTRPEQMSPLTREQFPHGYFNLGVAHGTPGVIALLGAVCAVDVAAGKARALLDGAVAWLLAQELIDDPLSRFPSTIVQGAKPSRSRLAWCYGDLGIAAALLSAARSVGDTAWESEAIKTARIAARRPPDQTGVVDAGLCHGAVGNAHFFNRMF